jgi:SNF2 family DNA or RNA helicase
MNLPNFLKPFEKDANLQEIGEIAFSGPTYQVQVDGEWAFIQLNDRSEIKDSFCTCAATTRGCVHQAAAFSSLFDGKKTPLHQRFDGSFWKELFFLYHLRFEDAPSLIQGHYLIADCIEIKGKSKEFKKFLKETLEERKQETEETSLKFSNLSEEEIAAWKRGKPNAWLGFELSFWSDLAKWFMVQKEKLTFSLLDSKKGYPEFLICEFPSGSFKLPLFETDLPKLIPLFAKIPLPLSVHQAEMDSLEKIVWDRQKLKLIPKKNPISIPENGVDINGWRYVSGVGFFATSHAMICLEKELEGKEIGRFLTQYLPVIKDKIEGVEIREDPISLSYRLQFDPLGNLTIRPFAFQPNDLLRASSCFFGNWAFIEKEGLFPIENNEFDQVETVIPQVQVPNFIWEKKEWLTDQPGFQIHLKRIETKISYQVTDSGLEFFRTLGSRQGLDFGFWIYIPDEGFYPKVKGHDPFPIKHELKIKDLQVPSFIRKHQEELKIIPGFFSEGCPLEKVGVKIALTEQEKIIVSPLIQFTKEAAGLPHRFFEEFIFIQGLGFFEIPGSMRLPLNYRHTHVVQDPKLFFKQDILELDDKVIEIDGRLTPFAPFHWKGKLSKKEGESYQLKLDIVAKKGRLPLSKIWQDLFRKKSFSFTEFGRVDLTDDFFVWLKDFGAKALNRKTNTLQLSSLELLRLVCFIPVEMEEGQELLEQLFQFHTTDIPDISLLKSTLRKYQWDGVKWLWFLFQEKLSGLLCDEMGLGKTHQAMALISACVKKEKKGPFIVLCPLSVIYHWEEKLAEFLPSLRVLTYHGAKRELKGEFDLLLTSYGTYRNDVKTLGQISFTLAILDEIQAAKNVTSLLWKAVSKLKAEVKIGLTGTPIENRLMELKSLFDLVVAGYMPKEADYKRFFVRPIEQEGDKQRKNLLTRLIKPFILRRKKGDVLQELPEKIEQIEHCKLLPDQANLYNEVIALRRESILRDLQNEEGPVPYIHIFALLSSLKQICNHPATYLKKPEEWRQFSSGKWDLFVELLSEARESGQKVVVFSQYLYMLDIIESYLIDEGIGFAAIRGATQDRGKEIARFNNDPACEVFVGSLQAAGWGIDLTAASCVIHYDRWWNAAREDQATDRVHRIGQKRGVQVFKLVTKGTFEERIDQLIAQKGRLMEEVVTPDDHRFLKYFDQKEILELLREVNLN